MAFFTFFQAYRNMSKIADFSAKMRLKKIDFVLMCICEVYNHFKLALCKTRLDKTTSSREMKRFQKGAKIASLTNFAKAIVKQSAQKMADFRTKLQSAKKQTLITG